jgi:hypothetical protein
MFPMLSFIFISNIIIVVILYDFCLLPAYVCYMVINLGNLERQIMYGLKERYLNTGTELVRFATFTLKEHSHHCMTCRHTGR